MSQRDPLFDCIGFEWDEANQGKNWQKHRVAFWECEQVFFNQPLVVKSDASHSSHEKRYYALGQSDAERRLFVAFTLRHKRIQMISTRDMTKKESNVYQRHEKKNT